MNRAPLTILTTVVLSVIGTAVAGRHGGRLSVHGDRAIAVMLFVGRAIAGITGASMAVTSAYIADVTPEDQRSRRFGQLGACLGIGPVIGGLLGARWVRAPALQSLVSGSVGPDQQGKLQGVMASTASLASVIGPVAISTIYFMSRGTFPGMVWIIGACLYLLCLPVLLRRA